MDTTEHLSEQRLADAWAELQSHANNGNALQADAYRLAFADPEFLLRRETRGIRFQLEMLKPDLAQKELGIENTIVVYGSARFREPAIAQERLREAEASGDAQAIARAHNLLRNALRFNPPEQPVLIRVQRQQQRLLLSVRDHGPGVAEAHLQQLGKPFFRAPGQSAAGHGLGLAIARRAAQRHSGELLLANHPEGGFIATLSLPLKQQAG